MECMPNDDRQLHEQDKDTRGEMFLTGRLQQIPNHPQSEFKRTTVSYTHLTLPTICSV